MAARQSNAAAPAVARVNVEAAAPPFRFCETDGGCMAQFLIGAIVTPV
jgi:hypothetical protein